MREILTDELLDHIAEDYIHFSNVAIHIPYLEVPTFAEYLKAELTKRGKVVSEWQNQNVLEQ